MFLNKPNLPDSIVKTVAVSETASDVIKALTQNGIKVIEIRKNSYIESKISSHADMNLLMLNDGKYIAYEKILPENFQFIEESKPISDKYFDCSKLNLAIIGNKCFCNKKTATDKIDTFGYDKIEIKQGYSKCSILIIDNNSIITADKGIFEAAVQNGLNALMVSNDDIKLNGYKNGFIGGIGGKLNYDLLAVSGNIKLLKEYNSIKSFCRNVGVYIEELTNNDLYDIGGIIPIEV